MTANPFTMLGRTQAGPRDVPTTDLRRRQIAWGWVMLSPWVIGFLVFTLLPMAASLVFTFTDFTLSRPDAVRFVGLRNWQRLFTDPTVRIALRNTLLYALVALPFTVGLPVLLAALLNHKKLLGKRLFRTLFYLPYMVPAVSAAYIFEGFLNPQGGWLNGVLVRLGLPAPAWLYNPEYVYIALFFISLWGVGNAMLITLAGMQGVPTELYEAAKVDGANGWRAFTSITLPLISPVVFYNLVLTVIALFRFFDVPFMLKGSTGDPANSTMFYNIYLYRVAFAFQNMGYGATLAWLLFILALVVTVVVFWTSRFWVYYSAGEDR